MAGVYGYLSVCLAEIDDEDDPDLNFVVLAEEDAGMLDGLTLIDDDPEEWVRIEIHGYGPPRIIYRVVCVSEVLFIPGEFAVRLPFV